MTDFRARVIALQRAAWSLRRAAPPLAPGRALPPFALALFTDDRRQDDVLGMLRALPGAETHGPVAVIFRHDGHAERGALAQAAMGITHAKGHVFLMARQVMPGADGIHGAPGPGLVSLPVHDLREAAMARRARAALTFVSPVFPTRSHPGAAGLGAVRAGVIARQTGGPAYALGGIDAETALRLRGLPFHGFGAIGAFRT